MNVTSNEYHVFDGDLFSLLFSFFRAAFVRDGPKTHAEDRLLANKIHKQQPGGEAIHTTSVGVPKPWRSVSYWPRTGPKRVVEHVRKLDSTFSRCKKICPPQP